MHISNTEISWLRRDKRHSSAEDLRRDISRLEAGEPLAYVIGWVDFLGCKIDLSQRPLIPRPETEYWAEKAIQKIKAEKGAPGCLDLFAGSGCVGLAVLKHVKAVRLDFADNDPRALAQIKINLRWNRVRAGRSRLIRSDVFKNIKGTYDLIFANPPYIPSSRESKLSASVTKYEPRGALFGGGEGLRFIRRTLLGAKSRLRPEGELWLEFDSGQKSAVARLAKRYGYSRALIHKDQFGRTRYAIIKK